VKLQIYNKAAEEKTGIQFKDLVLLKNLGADTPILIQEQQKDFNSDDFGT